MLVNVVTVPMSPFEFLLTNALVMAEKEPVLPPQLPVSITGYGVIQLKADAVIDEWADDLEDEVNTKQRADALTRAAPKADVRLLRKMYRA